MPAKNLTRINGEATYCHIYNRGVEKRVIFCDGEDYKVFQGFLEDYLTPQNPTSLKKTFQVHGRTFQGTPHLPKNYLNKVELIAYNLMPNQFHLLLHQLTEGSLENFLRSLGTRYSMYFNKKYHRSGALFEGPYKSVQIKDKLQLPPLTGFFHHSGKNSSYPEYLGSRKTAWVKPEVVLSFFDKGTAGYKDFVEKYEPDQKEKDNQTDLERSPETPLKRIGLASSKEIRTDPNSKLRSRLPEFMVTSILIFVLLVGIGVRNIQVSAAKNYQPLPSPAVLSETQEVIPATTLEATSAATLEATSAAKPEMKSEPSPETLPETKAKTTLIVKIDDGSSTVNIRQKPTINSEKVDQAHDGDTFEFVSLNSGWYKIKLTDGSTGFISKKYAAINGGNN